MTPAGLSPEYTPGPLRGTGPGSGDHLEAQYRTELFSYRTPEATQLSAMCSRLLALTVTQELQPYTGLALNGSVCHCWSRQLLPGILVQPTLTKSSQLQAGTGVAPSTEVIAAVLPRELAEESSGLLADIAAYVQHVRHPVTLPSTALLNFCRALAYFLGALST